MKNRAKCKLCEIIIESFHPHDKDTCKCGEISVMGGIGMFSSARNYDNFLRIDDLGNEIVVKVEKKPEEEMVPIQLKRKDYIQALDEAIQHFTNLPDSARFSPVNQYEMEAYLKLLLLIFQTED